MWLLSAWLANNVPSWLLLLTLSVLIAGGAALVQMFVRRGFPGPKEDAHNDVMRFTLTAIAFLSGFMIKAMWGQINGADARAATEGSAAMQQAKSLTVFDKADSDRIRQNLLEYVARVGCSVAIVASDQTYPKADNALHRLYTHTEKSSRATKRNRNSSSSL